METPICIVIFAWSHLHPQTGSCLGKPCHWTLGRTWTHRERTRKTRCIVALLEQSRSLLRWTILPPSYQLLSWRGICIPFPILSTTHLYSISWVCMPTLLIVETPHWAKREIAILLYYSALEGGISLSSITVCDTGKNSFLINRIFFLILITLLVPNCASVICIQSARQGTRRCFEKYSNFQSLRTRICQLFPMYVTFPQCVLSDTKLVSKRW